jgi:hypothetical protein
MHIFRPTTRSTSHRFLGFPLFAVLAIALITSACTDPDASSIVTPGPVSPPSASGDLRALSLVGTIRDISESTRTIALAEPVDGVAQIKVSDETGIHQVGETGRRFSDLRPGMRMEVAGLAGPNGVLTAQDIIVIGTASTDGPNVLPPLDLLEQSTSRFISAVGRREPELARQFLTPELSAQLSDADLSAESGVQALGIITTQTSLVTPSRVLFIVGIAVRVGEGPTGEWQAGQNNRYVEFLPSPQGWRIAGISPSPIS